MIIANNLSSNYQVDKIVIQKNPNKKNTCYNNSSNYNNIAIPQEMKSTFKITTI